jgi:hypothetical protein
MERLHLLYRLLTIIGFTDDLDWNSGTAWHAPTQRSEQCFQAMPDAGLIVCDQQTQTDQTAFRTHHIRFCELAHQLFPGSYVLQVEGFPYHNLWMQINCYVCPKNIKPGLILFGGHCSDQLLVE